ncbi:MAG: gliding motility protein GldC [Deinococcales bacterium]
MKVSDISIAVFMDEEKNFERIRWSATDALAQGEQEAKAMMVALWDADARSSLRVDIWTKDMTIHDMNDFFFQTLLSMADTYKNATQNLELMADIKQFAREFAEKAAK